MSESRNEKIDVVSMDHISFSGRTFGTDVEYFIKKDGEFSNPESTPALLEYLGDKAKPKQLAGCTLGIAAQLDNVSIEMTVPSAPNGLKLWGYLSAGRAALKHLCQTVSTSTNIIELVDDASAEFDPFELLTENAMTFGCDPDFNPYTLEANPRPSASNPNLRTCGGHLHIGYYQPMLSPNEVDKVKATSMAVMLAKTLDFFIGLPLTIYDPDKRRTQLYGKPGAFRFKPYGLEYRVPSNWWTSHPVFTCWVINQANHAMDFLEAFPKGLTSEEQASVLEYLKNPDADKGGGAASMLHNWDKWNFDFLDFNSSFDLQWASYLAGTRKDLFPSSTVAVKGAPLSSKFIMEPEAADCCAQLDIPFVTSPSKPVTVPVSTVVAKEPSFFEEVL